MALLRNAPSRSKQTSRNTCGPAVSARSTFCDVVETSELADPARLFASSNPNHPEEQTRNGRGYPILSRANESATS
jgi:hypothetical protein